ncbi:MAG: hypothetical protein AB1815_03770 [Bacillota bacterium]|jgi:hypothetical protein
MKLWNSIIKELELTMHTPPEVLRRQIQGAFCGDLLSNVLAGAAPGDLWITIHRHRNIIAVAALVNLSGVIITGARPPDPDTLGAAGDENIPLFTSPLSNFEASGRLYTILKKFEAEVK